MTEDLGLFTLLAFMFFVSCVSTYQLGRRLERKKWEKALPEEMMKLCLQCRDLGGGY